MTSEAFYGSSEYSPEAEELFAHYVREVDAGATPDFEAFCAEHEEWGEELYGLHADWDNVRGLLAKLGKASSSEAEQTAALERALEAVEASPPDVAPTRSRAVWIGVAVIALALAGGLGGWAWSLFQAREVLAREQSEGLAREEQARLQLDAAREAGLALAKRGSQLELELTTTTEAVVALEGHKQSLITELDEERALAAQTRLAAERSAAQAEQLATLVALEDLIAREDTLWPTAPDQRAALEAWVAEAELLAARLDPASLGAPGSDVDGLDVDELGVEALDVEGLGLEPAQLARARGRLELFAADGSDGGLLAFTRERLARIAAWEAGQVAEGWEAVLEGLPPNAPVPPTSFAPLRTHPATELWIFADAETGDVPERDEEGNWTAGAESALLFALVTGGELEGVTVEGFLLALDEPSLAHLRHALGPRARSGDETAQGDWARLDYSPATSVQRKLALLHGLEWADDAARPVRPLTAAH